MRWPIAGLIVYVNDNYGAWRSSRQELVETSLRHFDVAVPRDAVAHIHQHLADASLELMELNMDADICDADDCTL